MDLLGIAILSLIGIIAWFVTLGPCNLTKCRNIYIPQYFKSYRKRMKKHNLNLTEVISSLYRRIPSNLNTIEEAASSRIVDICNAILQEMSFDRFTRVDVGLTGSTAERFNIPISPKWLKDQGGNKYMHALMSDFDFMLTPPELEVSNAKENSQYNLELEDSNLKTGFVYVIDKESKTRVSGKKIMKDIKNIVLSLTPETSVEPFNNPMKGCCNCLDDIRLFRRLRETTSVIFNYDVKIQGPAISLVLGKPGNGMDISSDRFVADVTFALKCADWPSSISDWGKRSHRKWPSNEFAERIISQGCHIVPKSQESDKEGLTWRISFSSAEVELSKCVPEVARMCFIGIKVIAKDYLSITCRRIKSYHVKSIFLYTLERTDLNIWSTIEGLEIGFRILIESVKEAIATRHCPHFWIPQVNLFKDLTRGESEKLLKVLKRIEKSPEKYIKI